MTTHITIQVHAPGPIVPTHHRPGTAESFATLSTGDGEQEVSVFFPTLAAAYDWLMAGLNELAVTSGRASTSVETNITR